MTEPLARSATIDDLPAMLSVIEAAFPAWPAFELNASPLDHLRWKLGLDVESAVGDHAVVELDGQVVAVRLSWSADVQVGANLARWENSAELAVHPDLQGRGISHALNTFRDQRFRETGYLGFGTLSPNPQVRHMDQTPWDLHPLTIWTRMRSPRTFAATHLRSGGIRQLLRATRAFARQPRVRGIAEAELPSGVIAPIERFDERTDAIWETARTRFDVVTRRTADYLNWRHIDPRGGNTLALVASNNDSSLGYVVFKRDGNVVKIVDLLVEPQRIPVLAALLEAGINRFSADGHQQFVCWLPTDHPYDAALRSAGFIATTTDGYVFANRLDYEQPEAIQRVLDDQASRFHITLSDFDFV